MRGEPGNSRADREYHERRARDEAQRSASATSACAKRAHLELAQLHLRRFQKLDGDPRAGLDRQFQNNVFSRGSV